MSTKMFAVAFVFALALSFISQRSDGALFRTTSALNESPGFALDPMFDSVGLLAGTDKDGQTFAAGSGVLIDPYWVLTAGHVPFDAPGIQWEEMRFRLTPDVLNNLDIVVAADAWFTYPGYDRDIPPGKGNDIGLVRLSEPILDVEPAVRFYGTDEPGMHMYMSGYGLPGVWPNTSSFDGIRRAGENVGEFVDSFPHLASTVDEQYWLAEFSQFASDNPLPMEWAGSDVDSGGGWFADIDGTMQLVGINGFGRGNNTITGAIRVSLYNDWIDEMMVAHSTPEPSSIALAAMAALGVFGLGRRRN